MSDYVKLAEPPHFVMQYPTCSACRVDLDHDGDGWTCPNCGTSWAPNAGDGDTGDLYESWSGEEPSGETLTEDEAADIAYYRERLDNHRCWPDLVPEPRKPAALSKVGESR